MPEEDEPGGFLNGLDRAVVELAVLPFDPDRAARPQVDLGDLVREPANEFVRLGDRSPHPFLWSLDDDLSPDLVRDLHPDPPATVRLREEYAT